MADDDARRNQGCDGQCATGITLLACRGARRVTLADSRALPVGNMIRARPPLDLPKSALFASDSGKISHRQASASLFGCGRDYFPVGIARGDVARERPRLPVVGDLFGIAVNYGPGSVARGGEQLGDEVDCGLGGGAASSAAVTVEPSIETKRVSAVSPRPSRSVIAASKRLYTSRDSRLRNWRRSPSAKLVTIIS